MNKDLFNNIDIECIYIIDAFDTTFKRSKPNIEIEDFIYPEIILELSNHVFSKKKGFNKIHKPTFMRQIKNESIRYRGVLDVLEFLKDENNPKDGMVFSTKDSSFKGGLANNFNLKGNNIEINKIIELDKKYPDVKSFLTKLATYD